MLYRRRYRPLFRMVKRRRTYSRRNRKFKSKRISYGRRRTFKKRIRRMFKRRRLKHLSKFKKLTGFGKHVRMLFGHYHHAVGASGDFTYADDILKDNLNTYMAGTEKTALTLLMKPYQQIKTEGADIVNQAQPITNWNTLNGFGSIRLFKVVFVVKNIGTTWKSQTTGQSTSKNQNIPIKVYLDRIGDLAPEEKDIDTRASVTVKNPSIVKFMGKTLPFNKAIKFTYKWGEKYMPTIQGDITQVDTNPRDIIEGFVRDSFLNTEPEISKYPDHPNRGELSRFLCFYKDHDIGTDNRENNEIKPQNNQSILYTYLDWDKMGRENTNIGESELPPTPYVHLSVQTRLYFICEQSQQFDQLFA